MVRDPKRVDAVGDRTQVVGSGKRLCCRASCKDRVPHTHTKSGHGLSALVAVWRCFQRLETASSGIKVIGDSTFLVKAPRRVPRAGPGCDDIGGIAVHIGARVSALAGPNDVLVSSTLRDLVIGSGLEFEERSAHTLKGVPGEWHLSGVTST